MSVVFETPGESVTLGRRGRPATFNDEIKAALAEKPGEWAVLQTEVKGRSRVSALRAKNQGYEFKGQVTGHEAGTTAAGEPKMTEIVKIFVRLAVTDTPAPAEVEAEAPKVTTKRQRTAAAK